MYGEIISVEKAKQMNGLALAYIGDTVFEDFVREIVIFTSKSNSVFDFHKKTIRVVNCKTQCKYLLKMIEEGFLTEDEIYMSQRGKNCKAHTVPKNADRKTYMEATGFECLIGYLYVTGNSRLKEILEYLREDIIKEIK